MANTFNLGNGNWAQKTEKLLAYNAENDNYKPLPFDFDRGSTATVVNKNGLIETVGTDEPRIDFLNNTKGHLLLEPSRQNKITHSIPNSNWAIENGASITENYSVSPDGSQNASRVQIPSGSLARTHTQFTVDANEDSISFYIKSNTGSNFNIAFYLRDAGFGTGRYSNTSLEVTNEWQRVKIENQDLSAASVQVMVLFYNTAGSGNTWDFSLWGVQAEGGSYATSIIPTSGSAVTRSAETCNGAGNSNVFNDSEGVLYVEALMKDTGSFKTAARITSTDISTSDGLWIYFRSDNKIQGVVRVGGVDQAGIPSGVQIIDEYHKVALKYKQNDFALWVNGTEVGTDLTGNTFSAGTLSKLGFQLGGNINPFIGNVKDIRVYNTALSDSELQALTS